MSYEEIMKIEDIQEKEEKLKEFYLTEIGVESWLEDKTKLQKIRFKDRFEYKMNGKLHRLNGPAVEFHSGNKGNYYFEGEAFDEIEWKKKVQPILREKKLKRIL